MQTENTPMVDLALIEGGAACPFPPAEFGPEHAMLVDAGLSPALAGVLVAAVHEHDAAGRPEIDLLSIVEAAEADRVEVARIGMRPEFAAAEAIIEASPADMGEVVDMVKRGDVEGARAAAAAFGHRLGSRVRAAFGLSGDADG